MLITMDSQWATPAWPGLKVLVRVGDTPAAALPQFEPNLPDDTSDWRVFYLTRTFAPLSLLQLVLDRLDRHRQFTPAPILLSPTRRDAQACAAALARTSDDPWLLELDNDPETGVLDHLLIGPGYAANPLFAQFFRALQSPEEQPLPSVLEQIPLYLGPQAGTAA